ncbi:MULTISPECIES: type II secretion system protein GspC [Thiomicrorhabdus]|uniref:Type II secretion system protein GspC n=1 Tax=Thiomicrorhabdus heinhorstiae TaxID=2748010 RepID=A0ABS0BW11_9GAMM|nr:MULTISPECIES: type II secretion system protein GspC [Thiomicrorhabdus]MBF6057979.1 type II secretion system protein GspC [Thiomicrorhabdus heinhorstiae]
MTSFINYEKFALGTAKQAMLARWLFALLLILIAWQAGSMASRWFDTPLSPQQPVLQNASSAAAAKSNARPDLVYLFGKPEQKVEKSAVVSQQPIQESRLNIKLIGLLKTADGGVAVVKDGGETKVVAVGEELRDQVELVEVLRDSVVVSNRGVLEEIPLQGRDSTLDMTAPSSMENPVLDSSQKERLQTIKEQLKQSPLTITQYVRFQPVQKNGKISAVKLWPRKEQAIFKALGFESGDLLKAVDGADISELATSPEKWQQMLNQTLFTMTLERKGQEISVEVNLN